MFSNCSFRHFLAGFRTTMGIIRKDIRNQALPTLMIIAFFGAQWSFVIGASTMSRLQDGTLTLAEISTFEYYTTFMVPGLFIGLFAGFFIWIAYAITRFFCQLGKMVEKSRSH